MARRELSGNEKVLTRDVGGDLGKIIAEFEGKMFLCGFSLECNTDKPLDEFRGYLHPGGLADKNEDKFWLYYPCHCGHDWSYQHFRNRVKL